ncbi:hypothetical protein EMM73_00395 [Rheinheimera sediminis]|uniref:hypothetical protein n=1 Tax=Rheinheimera sp. YQF-1 TaxID=2499626 RepID=UPI000FDAC9FD|nr:hypothetical protein [Rheinheimera sp. YQF-1]RVT49100.1 hypothetical protein EMM73_00395 [Rheinheimera sp. YQF-1]
MSQNLLAQSNFISLSAVLLRRFWLLLLAAAVLGAAALYIVQLSTAVSYQATAVVTLTDWQTERLTRRDDPNDKNPANVGGASADAMSRALLWLKDPDFFQSLARSANAQQLSVEHKRRGNLVTLKWKSNSATNAETELALVLGLWDQRWRQQFIQQKQQELATLQQVPITDLVLQQQNRTVYELDYAKKAQPFALHQLEIPKAPEQSERPALWLMLLFGAFFGFSCAFILLMLWRL